MRACTTASGGVMFIPETLKRKTQTVSYENLIEEADIMSADEKPKAFGKKKPVTSPQSADAQSAAA